MSTIKITQLPRITNIASNTGNIIMLVVDTVAGITSAVSEQVLAQGLYVNNQLQVGNNSNYFPNTIAQLSATSNNYVQVNLENINNDYGTADYIVTANTGNDNNYYIDLGYANKFYNPNFPVNSLGNALNPLDGYLYVQGLAGNPGGNLVIGTTQANTNFVVVVGGSNTANVILTANSTQLSALRDVNITGNVLVSSGIIFADGSKQTSASLVAGFTQAAFNTANSASNTATSASATAANAASNTVTLQGYSSAAFALANGNFSNITALQASTNTISNSTQAAFSAANNAILNIQVLYTNYGAVVNSAAVAQNAANTANIANATANFAYSSTASLALTAIATANYSSNTANGIANTAAAALSTANSASNTANAIANNALLALSTANNASNVANAISNTASLALTNSNTAINVANFAATTANNASNTANAIALVSTQASTTANNAANLASLASTTANNASNTAAAISGTATLALTIANNASNTAQTANTTANNLAATVQAAFNQANTGVTGAGTALTTALAASNTAGLAFNQSNLAFNTATSAWTTANNAGNTAILAWNTANTAGNNATLSYAAANTAGNNAALALGIANTAANNAQAAFNAANNAPAAFAAANVASNNATAAFIVANTAANNAISAFAKANAAANLVVGAQNVNAGYANQIVFQSASNTTSFITAPTTNNYILSWSTVGGFTWVAGTNGGNANYANTSNISLLSVNVQGGTANQIPYQSAANVTTYVPAPTISGQALYWTNTGGFTWSNVATTNTAVYLSSYSANGTANAFTLTSPAVQTIAQVYINGVYQMYSTNAYTLSGNTITFGETPGNGEFIEVISYTPMVLNGNLATGNVTTTGTITAGSGFVSNVRLVAAGPSTINVNFATDSVIKTSISAGYAFAFTNYTPGKAVQIWVTNSAAANQTSTLNVNSALNSTSNSTTYSHPTQSTIKYEFISMYTDYANTYVALTHA